MLAPCFVILLGLPAADSKSYHFTETKSLSAVQAIHRVLQDVCAWQGEEIHVAQVECHRIVKNNPFTNVCYAESDIGFWFVTKDMLDGYNVTFNRWD
jgi:hypothetical protein